MNKKTYYRRLEEYQDLISRKRFYSALCEQSELDKTKEKLIKEIRKFITYLTANMIEEQKRLTKIRLPFERTLTFVNYQRMQKKRDALGVLYQKIQKEENLQKEDYEDTYYRLRILCGLTAYELMAVLVATGIIALVHWFVNR